MLRASKLTAIERADREFVRNAKKLTRLPSWEREGKWFRKLFSELAGESEHAAPVSRGVRGNLIVFPARKAG